MINPKLIEIALQHCGETPFERYAQTVFGSVMGPKFKPLGGHKDGGADGFFESEIFEEEGKPTRSFQSSKEINVEGKISRTVDRLREVGRIAYNPTKTEVISSLRTIFPSLLGVRLGSRLPPHVLAEVIQKIKQAQSVDPARAEAIVSEHADALKANRHRQFVVRYAPTV